MAESYSKSGTRADRWNLSVDYGATVPIHYECRIARLALYE